MTQDTSAACPLNSIKADSDGAGDSGVAERLPGLAAGLRRASCSARSGFPDVEIFRRLAGHAAGAVRGIHAEHAPAVGRGRRTSTRRFCGSRCRGVMRSLYPIGGVVFDGDRAPTTGAQVRDYHVDIKGVDDQGRRYHALNPDVFYWAHTTFFVGTIHVAERFGGGLTEAEKRQLFDEHIQWYRMYGMSMRPVPAVLGGIPGLLGPHVPQRLRGQLRDAGRARPDRTMPSCRLRRGFRIGCGRRCASCPRRSSSG